jgi:hypothetical protein
MKFDVHHAGAIGGHAIGAFITTIEANDHRSAKKLAEDAHPELRVVVLPHRAPNEKLERALRAIERRPPRDRQQRHGRGGGR